MTSGLSCCNRFTRQASVHVPVRLRIRPRHEPAGPQSFGARGRGRGGQQGLQVVGQLGGAGGGEGPHEPGLAVLAGEGADIRREHLRAEVPAEFEPAGVRSVGVREHGDGCGGELEGEVVVGGPRAAKDLDGFDSRDRAEEPVDEVGRGLVAAGAVVHVDAQGDVDQLGGLGQRQEPWAGADVGAQVAQMESDDWAVFDRFEAEPIGPVEPRIRGELGMRDDLRRDAEPPLDLRGGVIGQREDRARAGHEHLELGSVVGLIGEVGMLEVVGGEDEWAVHVAERFGDGLQLLDAAGLGAEMHVHQVEGLGVGADPGGVEGHRRPPLPGGRSVDGRIGQHDDPGPGDLLHVRVGRRDRGDRDQGLPGLGRRAARACALGLRRFTAVASDPLHARRRHYAEFYGITAVPDDGRQVAVVHGNCQAESLRVVLEASAGAMVAAVRIPPVHELERSDLPHLQALLARADLLISQPVRADWRGLPCGTQQLAADAPSARLVMIPVVRHTGLHPFGALVRTPWMGDPPTVPYHDLRTILAAARGESAARGEAGDRPQGHGLAEGFRAVEAASIAELRRREARDDLVPVSDLIRPAGADAMLTINHPGNAVLVPLAGRILEACRVDAPPRDPGRTLLASIQAPRRADVLEALGLDPAAARDAWEVGGEEIADARVAADQAPWYADKEPVVRAALERYRPAIEALGL